MATEPDEDALTWAGESDPSHVAGPVVAPAPTGVEPVETKLVIDPDEKPQISSMLLVSYGVIAGAYLLYTVGWVIAIQRLNAVRVASSDVLSEIMFQLAEALAIASPALWFCAAILLTRGRKPIVRLLWMLIGLVAVLPWAFVLGAWV